MITVKEMLNNSYHRFLKPFSLSRIRELFTLFSFLILSFSITVSCNSGKNNDFNAGYGSTCADYIIDVRPEYSDQTEGQSFNINATGDILDPIDGLQGSVGGNTIRLELLFSLRQSNNSAGLFQTIGIGESRNLQGDIGMLFGGLGAPFGMRFEEHPSGTIADVVREAVRDGYEKLRDSLGDQGLGQQQLRGTISRVVGDRTLVALGLSDHVQEGDVFYVYPGGGYNSSNNGCNAVRRSGPYLTTGTVIDIDDKNSLLEMGIVQNRRRSIQVGDIVELSSEIDFSSRVQGSNQAIKPSVLRLGLIPNVFVAFRTNNNNRFNNNGYNNNGYNNNGYNNNRSRVMRRNITPYIRNSLTREAREYNFRIAQ